MGILSSIDFIPSTIDFSIRHQFSLGCLLIASLVRGLSGEDRLTTGLRRRMASEEKMKF
jgi:hypothetical protein